MIVSAPHTDLHRHSFSASRFATRSKLASNTSLILCFSFASFIPYNVQTLPAEGPDLLPEPSAKSLRILTSTLLSSSWT